MTSPLPTAPDPTQLAVELAAAQAVTGGLQAQLQEATRQIIGLYIAYAGSVNNPIPQNARRAFTAAAARVISSVVVDIRQVLWEMVWQALMEGQRAALSYLADSTQQMLTQYGAAAYHEAVAGAVSAARSYGGQALGTAQWAGNVVSTAQARLDAALMAARSHHRLAAVGGGEITFESVLAGLAPLQQTLNDLERDTRWAINSAFNQASRDISDSHGVARMWVAEEDACLHCLALSGEIAGPGRPFDADLTYYVAPNGNLKPLPVYPVGGYLWGPPRHPNCRCSQIPVPELSGYPVMPWEAREYHPAQALQREARRSVLRGDSGSDSLPARLRATAGLLAIGARLPRSVEARARAALRAGRYPDRRWDRSQTP